MLLFSRISTSCSGVSAEPFRRRAAYLLLVLVLLLLPILPPEREALDATGREGAPGKFVTLSRGTVHFQLEGPEDGHVVVLVHGFSVPMFLWDATFGALTEAGYRVLRFDLFGRGFSDRPDTAYSPALFEEQLRELLNALSLTEPVTMVGFSMGAPIAARYGARHPARVERLVLIAPAGFPDQLPPAARVLGLPLIGEYLVQVLPEVFLNQAEDRLFRDPAVAAAFNRQFREQMRFRGYRKALLSSLRHFLAEDHAPVYDAVGKSDLPVLLLWGKEDEVIPFSGSERVQALIPRATLRAIDRAGHVLPIERPRWIHSQLIGFLGR